jgi:hypothetical protein
MKRFRVTIIAVEKQWLLHIPSVFVALDTVLSDFREIRLSRSLQKGHALAQLVKALRYNPEGRGFDSRLGH